MSEPTIKDHLIWMDDFVAYYGSPPTILAWSDIKAERDALRASLRDMVEYAEDYVNIRESYYEYASREWIEKTRADIAKARGLLK